MSLLGLSENKENGNNDDRHENGEEDNDNKNGGRKDEGNNRDRDVPSYPIDDFKGIKVVKDGVRYTIKIENKTTENPENPEELEVWIITD